MEKNGNSIIEINTTDIINANLTVFVKVDGSNSFYRFYSDGRIGMPGLRGAYKHKLHDIKRCRVGHELLFVVKLCDFKFRWHTSNMLNVTKIFFRN